MWWVLIIGGIFGYVVMIAVTYEFLGSWEDPNFPMREGLAILWPLLIPIKIGTIIGRGIKRCKMFGGEEGE